MQIYIPLPNGNSGTKIKDKFVGYNTMVLAFILPGDRDIKTHVRCY